MDKQEEIQDYSEREGKVMRKKSIYLVLIAIICFYASFLYAQDYARVGCKAPDFTAKAYFPLKNKFGNITLSQINKQGKWVVLFFYPADFTFA